MINETARTGQPVSEYCDDGGREPYLHSVYDQKAEAKQWARNAEFGPDAIVCVLGAGYFYHIRELVKKVSPGQHIVVIEKDERIFQHALNTVDIKEILRMDNVHIAVGLTSSEVINIVSGIQKKYCIKSIRFLVYLPSFSRFTDYYSRIKASLKTAEDYNIYDRLRYIKFRKERARVILIAARYHLTRELRYALKRMGIKYRLLPFEKDGTGTQDFIESIIGSILEFRPDFFLTVNHFGFDRDGALTEFFKRIEMPVASWYVDNPNLIVKEYTENVSPYCTLFLWDRDSLQDMKEIGFENVVYLPLGVDEKCFRPINIDESVSRNLKAEISFAGSSMVQPVWKSLEKSMAMGRLRTYFPDIAAEYMENSERHVEMTIKKSFPEVYNDFSLLTDEGRSSFEAAVCREATRTYRLKRLEKLLGFDLLIAGDRYWEELLGEEKIRHHDGPGYYDELPVLYNASKINFNATSRQMKGGVNQRVFDVPACRGFLLTDYQEQLEDLFEIGDEVVCYHEPDEIGEMAEYYLAHDRKREKIAGKGYERVVSEHTYAKRVERIIKIMCQKYK